MTMTERDKKILSLLLPVALISAYWILVLSPKKEESATIQDQLSQVRGEAAGQPPLDRHPEGDLATAHSGGGERVPQRGPQQRFRLGPADPPCCRQRGGELDHSAIEIRGPGFDRGSHAHPIGLREDVVDEPGLEVREHDLLEGVRGRLRAQRMREGHLGLA